MHARRLPVEPSVHKNARHGVFGGFAAALHGEVVFSLPGGGGGGDRAPENWGVQEKGSIDRTINQLLLTLAPKA